MTSGGSRQSMPRSNRPVRGRSNSRTVPVVAFVLAVLLLGWWWTAHRYPSPDGYRTLVRSMGWITFVLMIAEGALAVRKRMAYQGVGRLSVWLVAHVYFGGVTLVAVLLHAGSWNAGAVSSLLLASIAFTLATGAAGWFLSRYVPPLLTAMEENPAMIEDLVAEREESLRGLLELARDGSIGFATVVRSSLVPETQSWRRMARFYRNRSKVSAELFSFQGEHSSRLREIPIAERDTFLRASEYALRANKMESEIFLHRLLRFWVAPHIVATALTYALMLMHIATQLYY